MNLLAHLHLSRDLDAEGTAGNVLADFLPNDLTGFPPGVVEGIHLHRRIDAFTDRHPVVGDARDLFSPSRRRVASIIVDIAFDYTLSRDWDGRGDTPLPEFIESGYATIGFGARDLGERAAALIARMRSRCWLESYTSLEGIAETFRRIARRSEAAAALVGAEEEIAANLDPLQDQFDRFYPDLQREVAKFRTRRIRPMG